MRSEHGAIVEVCSAGIVAQWVTAHDDSTAIATSTSASVRVGPTREANPAQYSNSSNFRLCSHEIDHPNRISSSSMMVRAAALYLSSLSQRSILAMSGALWCKKMTPWNASCCRHCESFGQSSANFSSFSFTLPLPAVFGPPRRASRRACMTHATALSRPSSPCPSHPRS